MLVRRHAGEELEFNMHKDANLRKQKESWLLGAYNPDDDDDYDYEEEDDED